ncbi:hypothetical protein [Lysinibacillus piscis]|uniref:Uncharacterized protein n=1 Tax=Lysinibacillus piscis TaxID=2518931 RepID=A0ABQ5NJK5_9BACI|nr:hypothetical protein [Lysinibacillus sp. KH24]GLC88469.1 hypothetical protein LYSBPC_15960 [Lysinibacillus sp. KH24]
MNDDKNADTLTERLISYEQLLKYLKQGREIEFIYNGTEYFISHDKKGRTLWCNKTQLSDYYQDDISTVNFIKIEGTSIANLFKQQLVKIQTIF